MDERKTIKNAGQEWKDEEIWEKEGQAGLKKEMKGKKG